MAHDRRALEEGWDRVELRGECRTSRLEWNPAGTPALELVGFEFHDAARKRCPPAARACGVFLIGFTIAVFLGADS
jgi:hypothetical protein